eukprot:COSAG06_NODE_70802_length_190_cov_21.219780_1_plen_44_part_10
MQHLLMQHLLMQRTYTIKPPLVGTKGQKKNAIGSSRPVLRTGAV